jgi:glycerate kinase
MVRRLDEGLVNLAAVIRRDLKMEVEDLPGAGAAGGLGAGLLAFAGAELLPGVGVVAQAVDLPRRICRADLVITGEGKLDAQSAAGKTAAGVARLAAEADRPVICICGQAAPDAPGELFRAVYPLVAGAVTVERALADAVALLTERTRQALAEIGHG